MPSLAGLFLARSWRYRPLRRLLAFFFLFVREMADEFSVLVENIERDLIFGALLKYNR